MKDIFIPYELFLKIQEKGFDTESFHDDDICGFYLKRRSNEDIIPRSVAFCEYNQNMQQWNSMGHTIAPVYQQVTDWFHTKNTHIEIYFNASGIGYIITRLNGTVVKEITDDVFFSDERTCLNKAIEEALNFI